MGGVLLVAVLLGLMAVLCICKMKKVSGLCCAVSIRDALLINLQWLRPFWAMEAISILLLQDIKF